MQALFIDGVGRTSVREVDDAPPQWAVPMPYVRPILPPQEFDVRRAAGFPCAVFTRTDSLAPLVYRYSHRIVR